MSSAAPSTTHLVLIPSYNTGPGLARTVQEALGYWQPVWVIVDGSTDQSAESVVELQKHAAGLRVIHLHGNRGKGAAVLEGMRAAHKEGFRFALVMDSDGQHPADRVPDFMRTSMANPSAMILGEPEFGPEAPASRKHGRRIGNWWANLETLWGGVHDSLFGFRVYPILKSIEILDQTRGGRGFDFDTVLVVKLFWAGVLPINQPAPVRYFTSATGGVSHFRYLKDNLLLTARHTELVFGMILRLRTIWRHRRRARAARTNP